MEITKIEVVVLGAGVGGLGAGCWLKNKGFEFAIFDPGKEVPMNLHNGVHYLHSIPKLPFESSIDQITLTDAILHDGKFYHKPNLTFSLDYSKKVRDIQHPSSIMDVGKDTKVYMPAGNSNRLIEEMVDYIGENNFKMSSWISAIDTEKKVITVEFGNGKQYYEYHSIISTVPLDKMFKMTAIENKEIDFLHNSIHITNYNIENIVPNWMINIYIPSPDVSIYRASILNGICSVESIEALSDTEVVKIVPNVLKMFGLVLTKKAETYEWANGKIMSISRKQREQVVRDFASKNIYQIGRFGLWNRKLLVDTTINQAHDVVEYLKYGNFKELITKLTQ